MQRLSARILAIFLVFSISLNSIPIHSISAQELNEDELVETNENIDQEADKIDEKTNVEQKEDPNEQQGTEDVQQVQEEQTEESEQKVQTQNIQRSISIDGQPYETLKAAIDSVGQGENKTIIIADDVDVNETINIENKGITLIVSDDASADKVIKRASGFSGAFFNISKGGSLIIGKEDTSKRLILDGGASWIATNTMDDGTKSSQKAEYASDNFVNNEGLQANAPIVVVMDGSLDLQKSAIIQNNDVTEKNKGGAIAMSDIKAVVNIRGSIINNKALDSAGGIFANKGTLNIEDGALFSGNHAKSDGDNLSRGGAIATDIVDMWNQEADINIKGGEFTKNKADEAGAAFLGFGFADYILEGGNFYDNEASLGDDIEIATANREIKGSVNIEEAYVSNQFYPLVIGGPLQGKIGLSIGNNKEKTLVVEAKNGYVLTDSDFNKLFASNPNDKLSFEGGKVYLTPATLNIIEQPESAKLDKGSQHTLRFTIDGAERLKYQWYTTDATGQERVAINNANTSEYNVDTNVVGTYYYICKAYDDHGNEAISNVAKIEIFDSTLAQMPNITQQPQGGEYAQGEAIKALTVEASASDNGQLSYQWFYSLKDDLSNPVKIEGANDKVYTPSDLVNGTYYYFVEVTNSGPQGEGKQPVSIKSEAAIVVIDSYVARIDDKGYGSLSEAVSAATNGDEIILLTDISESGMNIANKNITINGNGKKIARSSDKLNEIFILNNNSKVIIKNIVIDGGAKWTGGSFDEILNRNTTNTGIRANRPLIRVNSGELIMEADTILQNNDNASGYGDAGGALHIRGGSKATLKGQILNNENQFGGAVMVYDNPTQVVVDGAKMSGNRSTQSGGAICLDHASSMHFISGEISHNASNGDGGAFWTASGSIDIDGGSIRNNRARSGSVIIHTRAGVSKIQNATIEDNVSNDDKDININAGNLEIDGALMMNDTIYLPNGKYIAIKGDMSNSSKIKVVPANIDSTLGGKIAQADMIELAKIAKDALFVESYGTYTQDTELWYGPFVSIKLVEDLPTSLKAMVGKPISLKVDATIEPAKEDAQVVYKWYKADNINGDNPVLIEGVQGGIYNSLDHEMGVQYIFCELDTSKYSAETIRTNVVQIDVDEFFPSSEAIYKFGEFEEYKVDIANIVTATIDNVVQDTFDRNEKIKISFEIANSSDKAQKIQINSAIYDLVNVEGNRYEAIIEGFASGGEKTIELEKIWLENKQGVNLYSNNFISIEISRLAPKVENFVYELPKTSIGESVNGKNMHVAFDIKDIEDSFESGKIVVKDQKQEIYQKDFAKGNRIELDAVLTDDNFYTIEIYANYKLSNDPNDVYKDKLIYSQSIAVSQNVIELKDVTYNELYYKGDGGEDVLVDILDITNGVPSDLNNYYVKLYMRDAKPLYLTLAAFEMHDDKLYVVAELDNLVHYVDGNAQKNYRFALPYKDAEGVHELIKSADELFAQMNAEPNGNFKLECDLDASNINPSSAAINNRFTGTLDGNGYKIYNLPTAMFNELSGAKIENLIIENAKITNNSKGVLANKINGNSVIEKVYITAPYLRNGENSVGTFAGEITGSVIKNSAAIDVYIKANTTIGGIVGETKNGAQIINAYVTGNLVGIANNSSVGTRIGGIVGWHSGKSIDNCITNINVASPRITGNGGIIGGPTSGSPIINNSIAIVSGNSYRISGFNVPNGMSNVYEDASSEATSNINDGSKDHIKLAEDIYSYDLYKNAMSFDDAIWNLELLSNGVLPTLYSDPTPKTLEEYEIFENKNDIPQYHRVRKDPNYQKDREFAYYNMSRLMPYVDASLWVRYGNELNNDDMMVKSKIDMILPLGTSNDIVFGVSDTSIDAIHKIRLLYEDQTVENYEVVSKGSSINLFANYTLVAKDMPYQLDEYINKESVVANIVEQVNNKAQTYTFEQIAEITPEAENRLAKDHYDEVIKPMIADIIRDLLYSQSDYSLYLDDAAQQAQIIDDLTKDDNLKRLLYAVNYYYKWYDIEFDGVKLSRLMLFEGDMINGQMTTRNLVSDLFTKDPNGGQGNIHNMNGHRESMRNSSSTDRFYNIVIKPYTQKNMLDFIADMARKLTGIADPNDWFASEFDGVLVEEPLVGNENVKYRTWDIFRGLKEGFWPGTQQTKLILPILSAPQEDMYLLSIPSQLLIGSMNRYPEYANHKDEQGRENIRKAIESYAEKCATFYGVSSQWIPDASSRLNSITNIQFDTPLNFPASEGIDAGNQTSGNTKDPVMKWVFEAVREIVGNNGTEAYANGTNVYWVRLPAIGNSDYSFHAFSHETAHNQDGGYFYGGNGRRPGTGGEAHADGNIAQQIDANKGSMIFNISKKADWSENLTNNFSYERIDSLDKVQDYYKEMFETGYALDYMIAKAFLTLTPAEQARIVKQATHSADGNSFSTRWNSVSEQSIVDMQLTDISDLWDNKLALRIQLSSNSSKKGSYGYESFFNVNWYQPHNDNGSPDVFSFKRLGQEMLGVAGYVDGYIEYMSGKNGNDLDALRNIMDDPNITWRDYKLARYAEVEKQLQVANPYFDVNEVIDEFAKALRTGDINNVTRLKSTLYGIVKRVTGDFTQGGIYASENIIKISSADEFVRLLSENPYGHYELTTNLDFSDIALSNDVYVTNRFMGVIDGKGHTITGLKAPIFKEMIYGHIRNLNIDASSFTSSIAYIASSGRNVIIDDVKIINATTDMAIVKSKSEGYYEFGNVVIEKK